MSDNPNPHVIRIVLTDEQRQRVRDRTGRDLFEIEISDDDGQLAQRMKSMTPPEVEKLAYRKAGILNDDDLRSAELPDDAAAIAAAAAIANLSAEIEKQVEADVKAMVAAFEVEGQAVEAARAAAKAAFAAAQKKKK